MTNLMLKNDENFVSFFFVETFFLENKPKALGFCLLVTLSLFFVWRFSCRGEMRIRTELDSFLLFVRIFIETFLSSAARTTTLASPIR